MAVVTRYFSTTAAGAGDGTTWADRAALFSGGAWSTVITAFPFTAGSDSLECRIGPGTYTIGASLASGSFTAGVPTFDKPLFLFGCDSSGNLVAPANPGWTADSGAMDVTGMPVLSLGLNPISVSHTYARMLRVTAAYNSTSLSVFSADWCSVENASPGTGGSGLNAINAINCQVIITGSAWSTGLTLGSSGDMDNVRVAGSAGTSGDRKGILINNGFQAFRVQRACVFGCGGNGIQVQAASVCRIRQAVIAGVGGDGINCGSTSTSGAIQFTGLMVTGCGGYGVNVTGSSPAFVANTRLRDNTSGNLNGIGSVPSGTGVYTTDSDDATEYADPTNGDYRIKYGSAIWGKGYGVSDEVFDGNIDDAVNEIWNYAVRSLTA